MVSLTGAQVRREAAERGHDVSSRQWQLIVAHGLLILEPEDDRWPPETVERLVRVDALGQEVRSLPRRVLRLRADYILFPISAERVREAMIHVIPLIARPVRKLKRIHDACQWMAWQEAAPSRGQTFKPSRWNLPLLEWPPVLRGVEPGRFDLQLRSTYAMVGSVLPAFTRDSAFELSDLPPEEQLTMLTVRYFALVADQRRAWEEAGSKLWQQ